MPLNPRRASISVVELSFLWYCCVANSGGAKLPAANEGNLMAEAVKRYEATKTEWDRIAATRQFKDLMATKKIFIVPAFIFFVVYYFALPVLVGYAPNFMATKVIGVVNIAYLFALSQFFMAWIIAGLYVKAANDFDRLSKDIVEKALDAKGAN
jgi:uncharacterized membrane protein (DUF485 family)